MVHFSRVMSEVELGPTEWCPQRYDLSWDTVVVKCPRTDWASSSNKEVLLPHSEETADELIAIDSGEICPDCGEVLKLKEVRDRTVIETEPAKPKKILYHLYHKKCPRCRKIFRAKASSVLPKSLYGNLMTAQRAVMHYFHGIPMGRIFEMTGISLGSLVEMFHRL